MGKTLSEMKGSKPATKPAPPPPAKKAAPKAAAPVAPTPAKKAAPKKAAPKAKVSEVFEEPAVEVAPKKDSSVAMAEEIKYVTTGDHKMEMEWAKVFNGYLRRDYAHAMNALSALSKLMDKQKTK